MSPSSPHLSSASSSSPPLFFAPPCHIPSSLTSSAMDAIITFRRAPSPRLSWSSLRMPTDATIWRCRSRHTHYPQRIDGEDDSGCVGSTDGRVDGSLVGSAIIIIPGTSISDKEARCDAVPVRARVGSRGFCVAVVVVWSLLRSPPQSAREMRTTPPKGNGRAIDRGACCRILLPHDRPLPIN